VATPGQACVTRLFDLFPLILQTQGESDYGDSSMPIYFMYSKIAEEEDTKIVENCHREADGTLIFVSPYISP
jgi:hypothetical protein